MSKKWYWIGGILILAMISTIIDSCSGRSNQKENTSPDSYIEAVENEDFTEAHSILRNLMAKYIAYSEDWSYADKYSKKFWDAANYIYKAEMQYLLPMKDPEADRRLLYTLDDFTPVGEAPEADYAYDLSEHNNHWEAFKAYINFVQGYNKLCLEMIRVALRNDNVEFAKSVLASMKENYHQSEENSIYTYTVNDRDRKEGQKLISNYENK